MARPHPSKAPTPGFSLIELLTVIAVLALLTVAAVASYGSSMVKTRRGAAEGCLLESAQVMERAYTINMTYAGVDFPDLACASELADHYTFGFSGTPDGTSYTVRAVPIDAQLSSDTRCGTLTLDQAGTKTESGSADNIAECW